MLGTCCVFSGVWGPSDDDMMESKSFLLTKQRVTDYERHPPRDHQIRNESLFPKLARQDSVDDFLASERVPKDAIRQYMADVVESDRAGVMQELIKPEDQRKTIPAVEIAKSTQNFRPLDIKECQLAIPKLKRQDSVDDFLADESSRRRCLKDFIQLDDESNICQVNNLAGKPGQKDLQTESATIGIQVKAEPLASLSNESILPPSKNYVILKASKTARKRQRTTAPAADHSGGIEERHERRREQNREAQRRFRERRKYKEFQAFSGRLAAAAGFQPPLTPFARAFGGLI